MILAPSPLLTTNRKRDQTGPSVNHRSSVLPVKAEINPWPQQSFLRSYKFERRPGLFVSSSFPFFSFLSSLCLLA